MRISLVPLLWRVADEWVSATDHNHKTLANRVLSNSSAFDRLREGQGITVRNYERLIAFLSADENWPHGVPPMISEVLGKLEDALSFCARVPSPGITGHRSPSETRAAA